MCSPVGVCLIFLLASLRGWRLTKIDVKAAFLKTGQTQRDVYVPSPCESSDGGKCVWMLLDAAYGLANANDNFKVLSDDLLSIIGFDDTQPLPNSSPKPKLAASLPSRLR